MSSDSRNYLPSKFEHVQKVTVVSKIYDSEGYTWNNMGSARMPYSSEPVTLRAQQFKG
jgi:hypothetical protein